MAVWWGVTTADRLAIHWADYWAVPKVVKKVLLMVAWTARNWVVTKGATMAVHLAVNSADCLAVMKVEKKA